MGSGEMGIMIDNASTGTNFGAMTVGDGGTMTLVGTGGGFIARMYRIIMEIYFRGANLTAGATSSANCPNTINLTGIGGTGSGGSHNGVNIDTAAMKFVVNGMNSYNGVNFLNCTGGSGGVKNIGVNIGISLAVTQGTLNFSNITGGSGGNNQYGIQVSGIGTAVTAPTIIAIDIMGGTGTFEDYGFFLNGAQTTFGGTATNLISISGGSLGTGTSEYGVYLIAGNDAGGRWRVGGSSITLFGTGGGLYSSPGRAITACIWMEPTLIAGNGGTTNNTINMTGIGGSGSAGFHHGVALTNTISVQLFGTNAAKSLNFINSNGGNSTVGKSCGVSVGGTINMVGGALTFREITGGMGGVSNHGVYVFARLYCYSADDHRF